MWGEGTHGAYEVFFMGCINVCQERRGEGGYGLKQVLFDIILVPINTATDLTRYIALPTRCARHFSLPHQALRLSQNNLHDTNHEQ